MNTPKKVLCLCLGNSDRSPVMAAVLGMFLKKAGYDAVTVESAGVSKSAKKGGRPAPFGIAAARRLGLDISAHERRHIDSLNLDEYDLFVVAADNVGQELAEKGVDPKKMFNAQVSNPWPVQFEQDYEPTMTAILAGMYRVVARYFPAPSFAM